MDTRQHLPREMPMKDSYRLDISVDVLVLTMHGTYGIGHYDYTAGTWKCFSIPLEITAWWYLPTYSIQLKERK